MFRDSFSHNNEPEQMDRYCRDHFGPDIQRAELERPGAVVLLGEDGGDVVAYSQMLIGSQPATLILSQKRPVEIERFYVARDRHGQGYAHQLMDASVELAVAEGADCIWLGVWKDNPRAIAFYKKFGFEIIGDQPFMMGTEEQRDYVMARKPL